MYTSLQKEGIVKAIVGVYASGKEDVLYDILAEKTSLDPVYITLAIQHVFPRWRGLGGGMKKMFDKDDDALAKEITSRQIEVKYATCIEVYQQLLKNKGDILGALAAAGQKGGGRRK